MKLLINKNIFKGRLFDPEKKHNYEYGNHI